MNDKERVREEKNFEKIPNLEQANWYFEQLGLDIRVGIDFDRGGKKFYVLFPKTVEYISYKNIWMCGKRNEERWKDNKED